MAKTGKTDKPYDPFNPGKRAFSALEDALGALDQPKKQASLASDEAVPPENDRETPKAESSDPIQPTGGKARSSRTRTGGGGEGLSDRRHARATAHSDSNGGARSETQEAESPAGKRVATRRVTRALDKRQEVELETDDVVIVPALKRSKKVLAAVEEFSRFDRCALTLGSKLGVSLDFSKVTRALWEIYVRNEEDILRNIPEGTTWERPSNNDHVGMAELDERLADLLAEGLMVASRRPGNARR